jgi:hypothetical protein
MISYEEIDREYIGTSPTIRQALQFIRTTEDEPWRKISTSTPNEVYELVHDARDHKAILVMPSDGTAYKFSKANATLAEIAAAMWSGADHEFIIAPEYTCFHDVMELPISHIPLLKGCLVRLLKPINAE